MKRRILIGSFTLYALVIVLTVCVILGRRIQTVPTSAGTAGEIIYAISYTNRGESEDMEVLCNDIEYMLDIGLTFMLPKDLRTKTSGGVILIFDNYDTESIGRLCEIIKDYGICAALIIDGKTKAEYLDTVSTLVDEGSIELCCSYADCRDSPISALSAISEARLEYLRVYGNECKTFVHRCSSLLCNSSDELNNLEFLENITIISYGNGKNIVRLPKRGLTILKRIERLPDWTIEEYFSLIAG